MRARRHFLLVVVSAVVFSLTAQSGPSASLAVTCPRGTSWDNRLQLCV